MKLSPSKVTVTVLLGVAVAAIGFKLLFTQQDPIKPFDYLSFLTGLAGFVFSLYQVLQESAAKETQRKLLTSLFESANGNIARVHQFSLKQEPGKNVSELLVGVLSSRL